MSNLVNVPLENRHLSGSLMEKILAVKDNSLVPLFFEVYKTEATGKGIKNVTVNNAGEMTFLPKGKLSVIDTGVFPNVWKKDGRQAGSFGKVLRKLLVENGRKVEKDAELEEIVNSLKACYTVEGTFEIVSGDDIRKYYLEDWYDYSFNIGTMESSCMRYSGACQRAAEWYGLNSNIEMVILKAPDRDKSRGRALLWTDRNGQKWLDRIYACDHITAAFKQFARSNGWPHKRTQDACAGDWMFPDGTQDYQEVVIELDCGPQEVMPYMDTFYYVYDSYASNSDDSGYDHRYCQREPDEQEENEYDDIDDRYIPSEDAVYIESESVTTHIDNAFRCELSDEWYLLDDSVTLADGREVGRDSCDIVYLDYTDEWYHVDDTLYCEFNNKDYPEDKVEWVEDLEMTVYVGSINEAYEAAGWVKDEDDNWVEAQQQLL